MVLCIFAQSLIYKLNRTKSNHDRSISFDLIRFGSVWYGNQTHKKVPCSISFDGRTASNSFVRLSSMESLLDFVRCDTPGVTKLDSTRRPTTDPGEEGGGGRGRYSRIYAIWVCTAVKGMIFIQFLSGIGCRNQEVCSSRGHHLR